MYRPKPYQQMTFPVERIQVDVKIVPKACKVGEAAQERLVQYTAIDEHTRLRYLKVYKEQNTDSSKDFLLSLIPYYLRRGIEVHCIQTDNGFEFTNRLAGKQTDRLTAFKITAGTLGIQLKHIRPYTPRHNGKVERSHREDQKRFYCQRSYLLLRIFCQAARCLAIPEQPAPDATSGFLISC